MLEERDLIDRFALETQCLGAIFCSYTFDPVIFEKRVLPAVLRIRADADENAAGFYAEALEALQHCPVAVLVDARMKRDGRRLPYDLIEYRGRTFHPKLAVLVMREAARVLIGSANLTSSGLEENVELAYCADCRYDNVEDRAFLREIAEFLTEVRHDSAQRQEQFSRALAALERQVDAVQQGAESRRNRSVAFLHSERPQALFEQLQAHLPSTARVTRVGVLAPFYEGDHSATAESGDLASVLAALSRLNGAKDATCDVAFAWNQPLGSREAASPSPIQDGVDMIWATECDDDTDYWTLSQLSKTHCTFQDRKGRTSRQPLDLLEEEIEEGITWCVGKAKIHGPANILHRVTRSSMTKLRVWLFPCYQRRGERMLRRSLHAKLVLISYTIRSEARTLVFLGSANPSRRALLQGVKNGGNVECGVVVTLKGAITLPSMVTSLVAVDLAALDISDMPFVDVPPDVGRYVESATFDASTGELSVQWSALAPTRLDWRITYCETEILAGKKVPTDRRSTISRFLLSPKSLELSLEAKGARAAVSINVMHVEHLSSDVEVAELSLPELLLLLGRRATRERMARFREADNKVQARRFLEAMLGERFSATDVFKAWRGLVKSLEVEGLSVEGFRMHLAGHDGAMVTWKRLRECATGDSPEMSEGEVWFYGAELYRALSKTSIPSDADEAEKRRALDQVQLELRADLERLYSVRAPRWMRSVARFYDLPARTRARERAGIRKPPLASGVP